MSPSLIAAFAFLIGCFAGWFLRLYYQSRRQKEIVKPAPKVSIDAKTLPVSKHSEPASKEPTQQSIAGKNVRPHFFARSASREEALFLALADLHDELMQWTDCKTDANPLLFFRNRIAELPDFPMAWLEHFPSSDANTSPGALAKTIRKLIEHEQGELIDDDAWNPERMRAVETEGLPSSQRLVRRKIQSGLMFEGRLVRKQEVSVSPTLSTTP